MHARFTMKSSVQAWPHKGGFSRGITPERASLSSACASAAGYARLVQLAAKAVRFAQR